MDKNVKIALKDAITVSLPILQPLTVQYTEPCLVWKRIDDHRWRGEYEDQPSLMNVFSAAEKSLEVVGSTFLQLFKSHHPEYGKLVGFPSFGLMNLLHDPSYILGGVLAELWNRYGTFQCSGDAVDAIVQEFEQFIDLPTARFRYMAQLLNFRMDPQRIEFPGDMIIRQLSEKEVSEIHGGPISHLGFKLRRTLNLPDYVLEGEYEEPKIFGDQQEGDSSAYNQLRQNADKAILVLRTFKEGPIGYESLRFTPVKFCPLPIAATALGYVGLYVPFGQYYVSDQEIKDLQRHAAQIFSQSDPAMEMACSRLADAQTRPRPQDRLVDAVIGLEALLLAGLRDEDRRGELRYRFALNYSTLFPSPEERYRSFRIAKDLYDLRSAIVHGGIPKENNCRLGDEKITLDGASRRACEMLRDVIKRFLPQTGVVPYKNPQYWERSYFGLPTGS